MYLVLKYQLRATFLRFLLEMGQPFYVVIRALRRSSQTSFLSYFKTLSIGPASWIEPTTSRSVVKLSSQWTNPAVILELLRWNYVSSS